MLNIGVIVSPNTNSDLSLAREVETVKSAILYGDKAELFSINFGLNVFASHISSQNVDVQRKFVLDILKPFIKVLRKPNIDPFTLNPETIDLIKYAEYEESEVKSSNEEEFMKRIESRIEESAKDSRQRVLKIIRENGMLSLLRARDAGLLNINDKSPFDLFKESLNDENAYGSFLFDKIMTMSLYPMFDSQSVKFFSSADNSRQDQILRNRIKQTSFAISLFEKLPNFQNATIDEIIDIRKELAKPLENFRAKVIEISRLVQSEVWDDQFTASIEDTYREKIIPAINEITDACNSNNLIYKIISKVSLGSIPAIGAKILSSAVQMDNALAMSLGVGVVGAGVGLYKSFHEYNEENKKIRSKPMYFYVALEKRLNPSA